LSASEHAIADINQLLVIYLGHFLSPLGPIGAILALPSRRVIFSFRALGPTLDVSEASAGRSWRAPPNIHNFVRLRQ
jgi:hypothetical protein